MIKLFTLSALLLSCLSRPDQDIQSSQMNTDTPKSIHVFKVTAIDGGTIDFAQFKGKKILIVNTASECGYTPQYKALQQLYSRYKDKLVVVGFPANNFGQQEPGSNQTIQAFCTKNYGVDFPMAAKISVKGSDMAPIYRWLTNQSENGVLNTTITWNFNKFLLNEQGHLLQKFESSVSPMSEEIIRLL